jgi:ubiquinone/menaquinone biosynthesis C-methylase UbiE
MAELFDEYCKTYKDVVADSIGFSGLKHDYFMQAKADMLERHLCAAGNLEPGRKLRSLDIGCGIGAMHPYVRHLFSSIDGCDISADSVEQARAEHPYATYTAYSGGRLPYDDKSFDFAMTVCVVHHVPPVDWPGFFAEMHRVLKPGGQACVIEHNPLNPATRLAVLRCPFDEDAVLLRSSTTRKLLRNAGFADARSEFFLLLPTAGALARRIEALMSGIPIGAQYACFARA